MARTAILGALVWAISVAAWADGAADQRLDNWHQWRGPESNGAAPKANPPLKWDEQTNVKWKVAIPGSGTASPVIWGDRIFILTAIKTDRQAEPAEETAAIASPTSPFHYVALAEGDNAASDNAAQPNNSPPASQERPGTPGRGQGRGGPGRDGGGGFGFQMPKPTNFHQFVVLCFDRRTGKTLWEKVAREQLPHEGHHQTGSFAAGSPVTDGRYVYCSFGSYGIYCYDMDGNFQWEKDLGDMRMRASFGEGASPTLHGDRLLVNWDHEGQSYVYALDAGTGEVVWQKERDEASSWNTPLVTEYDGRTQVILNGEKRVRSYDLANGDLIWECGGQTGNPIPSPMRLGDMTICVSGFRGAAAYAIPLDSTGDITDTDQVAWHHGEGTPYVSSAALAGDRLFFTKDRAGIMTCLNARTGEVIIDQKRLPGLDDIYASPVTAAGRVYFTGRNGNTVVVDAKADKLKVLAENSLDESIDASPALVDSDVFIRGNKSLYCIAE